MQLSKSLSLGACWVWQLTCASRRLVFYADDHAGNTFRNYWFICFGFCIWFYTPINRWFFSLLFLSGLSVWLVLIVLCNSDGSPSIIWFRRNLGEASGSSLGHRGWDWYFRSVLFSTWSWVETSCRANWERSLPMTLIVFKNATTALSFVTRVKLLFINFSYFIFSDIHLIPTNFSSLVLLR